MVGRTRIVLVARRMMAPRLMDRVLELAVGDGVLAVLSPRGRLVLDGSRRGLLLEAVAGEYGLPVLLARMNHACTGVLSIGGDRYEALVAAMGEYDQRRLSLTAGVGRRRKVPLCMLVSQAIERMCVMGASPARAVANVASWSPRSLTLVAWPRRGGLELVVAAGTGTRVALDHSGYWLAVGVEAGDGGRVLHVGAGEGVVRVKKVMGVEEARRL